MRKIVIVLVVFLLIGIEPIWALPQITGKNAVLMDEKSGQVLYELDKDEKVPPASTTKIMTGILAVESGKLDEMVTIGANPPLVDGTRVYLEEGEKVKLEELLYAALVYSANDAALAIAEYLADDEKAFVLEMNKKAKELGAINTNFVNSHGLTADGHSTTAYDLALMGQYAMKNETFRRIVQAKVYDWKGQAWQTRLINKNELLWSYDGADGIKTGYTKESKNTIVATATRDERTYLAVVLGSSGRAIWKDASALLDYGFNNFKTLELADPTKEAACVNIDEKRELKLVPKESFNISLSKDGSQKVEPRLELQSLDDKIIKGQKVGEMSFFIDEEMVGQVDILANNTVKVPFNYFNIIIYLGAGLYFLQVLWRIFCRIRRNKRRIRRNNYSFRDYSYRN